MKITNGCHQISFLTKFAASCHHLWVYCEGRRYVAQRDMETTP